jgi:hypothetical protein
MWGHLKFAYETPDHTKPNHSESEHAEPNQAPHHQIVMYKQKQEQYNCSYTKIISFFFGTLSIILFFKEAQCFGCWLHF